MPKLILASSWAATIAISFVVVITIWAERSAIVKQWLSDLSGHHWTSKGILEMLLYILSTALFYHTINTVDKKQLDQAARTLLLAAITGTIALTVFFVAEYFHWL